ncbi:MAG: pyrroline-5-carboxylate reductase family protein [Allosphingosinicella sp.]|uniref:pyrroline-5-carboxylate reductase family protein n=1 Tax=Allosphingosinicella sp. TaxID=2823234 RepID=UPI0039531B65
MTDPLFSGPIWLVGCGNMAGAMLEGWLDAGLDPARVTVIRPSGKPAPGGVRVRADYPEDEVPALVLLGMKPYQIDEVAPALAPLLGAETLLVSILAGVELASHRARFPAPRTIVRAMPNTPVRLRKGVVNLFAEHRDTRVERLMGALGRAEWLEEERLFQLAGVLTGAGPAFLFRFIDALAEAGREAGLEAEQALRLARLMVEGAGALAAASDAPPAELARRVASPGGTTQAGLDVLDQADGMAALLRRTVAASLRRSDEMAAEARARPS